MSYYNSISIKQFKYILIVLLITVMIISPTSANEVIRGYTEHIQRSQLCLCGNRLVAQIWGR